jgi:hypothetical protein
MRASPQDICPPFYHLNRIQGPDHASTIHVAYSRFSVIMFPKWALDLNIKYPSFFREVGIQSGNKSYRSKERERESLPSLPARMYLLHSFILVVGLVLLTNAAIFDAGICLSLTVSNLEPPYPQTYVFSS